ncbi:MAG TPA: dual specificity protein phosphatase family protein [Acidimicrobiales bacterium]|nr:dual specificity protein phosphatase family protein [Acidimicrobiales bacterium]
MTATTLHGLPLPVLAPAGPARRRRILIWAVLGTVAFFLVPNLVMVGVSALARRGAPAAPDVVGVKNFAEVDDRLWRGAAPGRVGYRSLADHGVTTVIDLRAEDYIRVDEAELADLGITRIHLPLRDGQSPGPELVERFLAIVRDAPGRVFLHCGAGVGRTGTLAAAYLVSTGQASGSEAVRRNLQVGPPSLEQVAFSAQLDGRRVHRPATAVVAMSRVLDAPRRIWVNVRRSYR